MSSFHIFLLPCGLYSALRLCISGTRVWKKYQTMNKPVALFSILRCNLITWCKHFIVSKLFLCRSHLTVKWEVWSLHRVELKVSRGSINHVCVSAPRPRRIARPAIEVVSAEPFCQVKHSKKPMTRKPQRSPALTGPCTPHVLPKLAWMAGVIRADGGETGVSGWSCVCLWKETFC